MNHIDILVGRIALERGLVTRDQLLAALSEAEGPDRPDLGQVLVRHGHISQPDLDALLQEQKRRVAEAFDVGDSKLEDALLGRLLVRQGLVTEKQLYECLREQAELSEHGKAAPRLGEILVRKKFLATDAVSNALQIDKKARMLCTKCGARFRTLSYNAQEAYTCKKCQGRLIVEDAESTTGLLPVSREPLPADVEDANRDPANRYADGKYIRIKEVGRGGMGVVWKAWQADLERYIAIKQMTPTLWSDTELKRFFREAQTAARLSHPNIGTIYEVGEHEGKHYIAMEFVDGDALSSFSMGAVGTSSRVGGERRTVKHLPLRHSLEVLRDAAGAVDYANSKGVIHRDIKPHNIMLARTGGRVFVMDFGLAKPVQKDGITLGDSILGTPPYMSPEQARGDAVDRRTDVYSLGAVMYFLLTGRAPYAGSSPADTLMKVLTEDPAPPHTYNPGLPPDLERICMKALDKDRHRRYETARGMADDLSRYLRGESVLARPMSIREKSLKWVRENQAKVGVIAVAVVMVAFLVFLGWMSQRRTNAIIADRLGRAEKLMAEDNYIRALAEYETILALDPVHGVAEQGRRKCEQGLKDGRAMAGDLRREADRLFEQGDFSGARVLFERVLRFKSDAALEERLRRCRAEAERSKNAIAELDQRARDSAVTIKVQAQKQEARKAAIPYLLNAITDLDAGDRLKLRGAPVADILAQFKGAEEAVSRALSLDASYLEARVLRAQLRHRLGDYAGGLEDYSLALADAPWSREAAYGRAYTALVRLMVRREAPLLRETDDLEPLEKVFQESVEAAGQEYPSDPFERWAVMALQELVARKSESAFEKMRTIALEGRAQPAYYFILSSIGLEAILPNEKRFAAAVDNLTKMLEIDPMSLEALYLRSVLRARINDAKGALEDAELLMKLQPNGPMSYLARAQASKLLGNYDQALKDVERAADLEPKFLPGLRKEIAELQKMRY